MMVRRYLNIFISLLLLSLPVYYPSPAEGKWVQNGATVTTGGIASRMYPSITGTGDGSGSAFIAWEELSVTPGDIYIQKIDINGAPLFTSDKDATLDNSASKQYTAIVNDGSGGAFVVWEDNRYSATTGTDIYIQRIDTNGTPVWSGDKVVCSASGNQWSPKVTLTSDGYAIVAWEDHRGAKSQIFAQKINADGNPVWIENGVQVAPISADQFSPAISSDGYDGAVVVWEDQRNSSTVIGTDIYGYPIYEGSDIYAQRINSSGTGQWGVDLNNDGKLDGIAATRASEDQWYPAISGTISSDGSGEFLVTWEDYRGLPGEGYDSYSDIYAKLISLSSDGSISIPSDDTAVCSLTNPRKDARHPAVAYSKNEDGFIIAWEDYRNDPDYTSDIYAQKINFAGTLSWASNGVAVSTSTGTSTAIETVILTDTNTSFTENALIGYRLNPNTSQGQTFEILSNTATTITIKSGDLTTVAALAGKTYAIINDYQEAPSIASSDSQGVIIAWQDLRSSTQYDIYSIPLPIPGSITIGDDATSTTEATVDLTLSATGIGNTIAQMRLRNDNPDWLSDSEGWEDYSTTKIGWPLTDIEGVRTLYVQFKDAVGNISPAYYDDIILSYLPTGSISINEVYDSGTAKYTNSTSVNLTISATNAAWMSFSNDAQAWISWETYSNTKNGWFLTSGDGQKTVYVRFKDQYDNISSINYSDNIILDTAAPTGTSLTITSPITTKDGITYTNSPTVTLAVSASDGTGSGMSKMFFNNISPTLASGYLYDYATAKEWDLDYPYPGDGPKQVYAKFMDNVNIKWGNTIVSNSVILDTTPPTGSISINSGATYTTSATVNLTISASDTGSNISQMCVSNSASCTTWEPYNTSKSWTLSTGDGTKSVYVQINDVAGNIATYSANIILDKTPPTATISGQPTSPTYATSATLTVSGTDVIAYKYKLDNGTYSPGEILITTQNQITLPSLGEGTHAVSVIARDALGNWQLEANATSVSWTVDTTPPTATITGTPSNPTKSTIATLTVGGADVVAYKYKRDNEESYSEEIQAATQIVLSLAEGDHIVYVRGKDTAGNWQTELNASTATWTIDTTPPTLTINTVTTPTNISSQTISGTVEAGATVNVTTDTTASDGAATVTGTSWSYATTGLATGTNGITVTATDGVGNTATATASITYDAVAPTVTITSPTTGTTSDNTPLLTYTVTDGSVVIKVDTVTVSKVSGDSLTMLTDGSHTVRVEATDSAGNMGSAEVSFTVDTTPPSVTINSVTTPTNASSQTITGTMESGATIAVTVTTAATVGTVTYSGTSWSCQITSLASGANNITVTATDGVGNTATATKSIVYDSTPPSISIDTVTTPTKANSQTIGGTREDGASIVVSVDTTAIVGSINYPTMTTWSCSISALLSGTNNITVTATDAANNSATATSSITVDNIAPTLTINSVTTPTNTSNQTITGTRESGAVVSVSVNTAATVGSVTYPTVTTWSCAINSLASGANNITVTAIDGVGNMATSTASITYDAVAPTVTITSPAAATTSDNTPLLTYSVSDGSVVVKVDTVTVTKVSGDSLSTLSDGNHTVRIEATDSAGNVGSSEVTFTVDTTPPALTINSVTTPTNTSNQTITGTRESGAVVSVSVNTTATVGSVTYPTATTWSCAINSLASGANNITVTAIDGVGNTATSTASITYDAVAPTVNITSPATGTTSDNTPLLTYTVTDGSVVVKVDNVTVAKTSGDSLSTLSDGSHTVRVEATDSAGNVGSSEVTFTIDTTPPAVAINAVTTPTAVNNQIITGTVDGGATVAVMTDTIASDGAATVIGNTWSYNISGLVDGANGITVTATDRAGNAATTTANIILNTTMPAISLNPVTTPTKQGSQIITGTIENATSISVTTNTGASDGAADITGNTWSYNITGLVEGSNEITVTAINSIGKTAIVTATIALDTTAPTGSISINNNAAYASSSSITLTLTCTDSGSGCVETQLSNDGSTWGTSESYVTSKNSTLDSGDGEKAVYARFKDNAGNWSITEIKDTISLDTTPPSVISTIPANGATSISANSAITVTFTERVINAPSSILLKQGDAIIDSTVAYDDSTKTATLTPSASLSEYTTYTIIVTTGIRDLAANPMASSYSFSFTTADLTKPSSTISTPSNGSIIGTAVTYTIRGTASDTGSGVSKIEISTDGGTNWNTATGTTSWTYSWTLPMDGPYTIKTRATDVANNTEDAVAGITVAVDNTPPAGTISINNGATYASSTSVALALSASDTNGIAQMQLSNDNSSWSSPETYTTTRVWTLTSGDGLKTVYARFKDNIGNWSTVEIKDTITLDTTILTGSVKINSDAGYTNAQNVTLTISGSNDVSEMQFSNNGTNWSEWENYATSKTWPLTAGDGLKTVYVKFKDIAGNISSSFSDTITLDTTVPISSIASPANGTITKGTTYTITGTSLDSASGVLKVEVSTDGGINWSEAGGTTAWTYTWTITDDGTYTIKTRATDAAGNVEVAGTGKIITVDNVVPTGSISINGGAVYTNTLDVTLTISASDIGSEVTKMQYGEALKGKWEIYADSSTYRLNSGEGTKTIYIQFMDSAGNVSQIYSDSITLDTAAPVVSITSPVSGATNNTTPTLTYTASDGNVMVVVDGAQASKASGDSLDALSQGSHTIRVEATDLAGNIGSSEVTIIVDTLAPDTSITGQPANPSNSTSPSFSFTSSEASSTFECRLDSTVYTSCISPISYTGLGQDSHTFYVRAIDVAGNIDSTPASYIWTIDETAPTVSIYTVITPTNLNYQAVSGTMEPGATISITTDTGAVGGTVEYFPPDGWISNISGLVEGTNIITVTITDAAGNNASITTSIILDTAPPEPQGTSPSVTLEGGIIVFGQTNPSYSYSNFTASWPSYSDPAGIKEYQVAIGDTANGTNVQNWIPIGTGISASTGDTQSFFETYKNANGEYFGKTFYLSVKAIDASGNESAALSAPFVYTPADINSKTKGGDGRVDGFDLGKLGIAFGAKEGDLNWDKVKWADIDMDKTVGPNDLMILGINFGKVKQ